MGFNRYRILLAIRLLVILGVMSCLPLAGKLSNPGQLVFTYLVCALVLVALVYELYRFLDLPLKEVRRFLEHIKNRDLSVRFNTDLKSRSSRELYLDFNHVLDIYQDIRIEKEAQFRFLEHIVELIEVGIIVFDAEERVVLSNTAASEYCKVPHLRSWGQVKKRKPELAHAVGSIDRSVKVVFENKGAISASYLLIQVSRTRMLDEAYSLMTIQDVSGEMEHKETGAWIRLLRTLNHEIKNAITPIGSLADTLMLILKENDGHFRSLEQLTEQHLADLRVSAETLQHRSKSFYEFVKKYNTLSRVPPPEPETIQCNVFLNEMTTLLAPQMRNDGITLKTGNIDEKVFIRADRGLLEQVLTNVVNNAHDALIGQENPCIEMDARIEERMSVISIEDNGTGIPEEVMEDIYTPFFSTKSEGSGLGLPLVRQIMRLHGGHVSIRSEQGKGTSVWLFFPSA